MKVELNDVTLASVHSLSVGASRDDVAPVITQIALKREGDSLRAMTTDRFVCLTGLYEGVAFHDWDEGREVLVDPSSLKSMLDIKKKDKSNYNLTTTTISSEDDVVRGNMPDGTSVSLGLPNVKGSFPPVMNLFPKDEPNGSGSLNIRPDFIAKLVKVLPAESRPEKSRVWEFQFRSIETPNKPQPVYATYTGAGYALSALIQPALKKS